MASGYYPTVWPPHEVEPEPIPSGSGSEQTTNEQGIYGYYPSSLPVEPGPVPSSSGLQSYYPSSLPVEPGPVPSSSGLKSYYPSSWPPVEAGPVPSSSGLQTSPPPGVELGPAPSTSRFRQTGHPGIYGDPNWKQLPIFHVRDYSQVPENHQTFQARWQAPLQNLGSGGPFLQPNVFRPVDPENYTDYSSRSVTTETVASTRSASGSVAGGVKRRAKASKRITVPVAASTRSTKPRPVLSDYPDGDIAIIQLAKRAFFCYSFCMGLVFYYVESPFRIYFDFLAQNCLIWANNQKLRKDGEQVLIDPDILFLICATCAHHRGNLKDFTFVDPEKPKSNVVDVYGRYIESRVQARMALSGDNEIAAHQYVVKSLTLSEGQSDIEVGMESTPMAFAHGGPFEDGSMGMWNHDCLRDLVMLFLFLKVTSPGRAFPHGFKNTVTPVVVALCLTIILCRLHHYRGGPFSGVKLSVSAKEYQGYFLYFLVEVSRALENDVNGVLHDTYQMWWQQGLKKYGVSPLSTMPLPRLTGGLADWTPDKAMIPLETLTGDTMALATTSNDPVQLSFDDILAADANNHNHNYNDYNDADNYDRYFTPG